MAALKKVRIQLLDENTGAVIEEVDIATSADAVTFADGETFQQKLNAGKLRGEQGPQGTQGPKGEAGIQGPKGEAGTQGAQGERGIQGTSFRPRGPWSSSTSYTCDSNYIDVVTSGGSTYRCKASHTNQAVSNTTYWELIAQKGSTGDRGPQGEQGPQGIQGERGIQGPQGIQGATGAKGETGAQGATGAKGETGAKGATGTSFRPRGAWSSSTAYVNDATYIDVVTSDGNTYRCKTSNTGQAVSNTTYWELMAQKGDTGAKGATGDRGATGATGAQGERGPQGIQGERGPQGALGPQGPKGDPGDNIKVGTTALDAVGRKLFFKVIG